MLIGWANSLADWVASSTGHELGFDMLVLRGFEVALHAFCLILKGFGLAMLNPKRIQKSSILFKTGELEAHFYFWDLIFLNF